MQPLPGQILVRGLEQEQESKQSNDDKQQIAELDGKIKMLYFKLNKTDYIIGKQQLQV